MIQDVRLAEKIGVGVDIEENNRFVKLASKVEFLNRIYTKNELKYCLSQALPAQHLAVRFAAKEAAVKALTQLGLRCKNIKDIEVVRKTAGVPELKIKNQSKLITKITLSHSRSSSIALVVIFKK